MGLDGFRVLGSTTRSHLRCYGLERSVGRGDELSYFALARLARTLILSAVKALLNIALLPLLCSCQPNPEALALRARKNRESEESIQNLLKSMNPPPPGRHQLSRLPDSSTIFLFDTSNGDTWTLDLKSDSTNRWLPIAALPK